MKKLLLAVAIAAALPISATAAAEATVKQDAAAATNPSALSLNDCLLILNGLNAIDEHIVVVGAKPNEQLVKMSYEYGPGGFRYVLAHNIRALSDVQRDAQVAQQRIQSEVFKGKTAPDKDATDEAKAEYAKQSAEYDLKLRELTAAPCRADLTRIKDSDLKLDKNELPAWALANMEKIRDK